MPQPGLPKGRLRRRGDFTGVFDKGTKRHGSLLSVFVVQGAHPEVRLGIAAGKKLGGAVERNRVKRRLRHVFRLAPIASAADVVVIPKPGVLAAPFDRVQDEFRVLVDHALRSATSREAKPPRPSGPGRHSDV